MLIETSEIERFLTNSEFWPRYIKVINAAKEAITSMVTTIKKSDLSSRMAKKMGTSKAQSDAALNALVESVQEALMKKEKVTITGFGTFEAKDVKARKMKSILGKNPGEIITVPKHKRVKFSAGSHLYEAAQGKKSTKK